jgi:hypothetical protein
MSDTDCCFRYQITIKHKLDGAGQLGRTIADPLDIEDHRAGNVDVAIFRMRVALLRQKAGAVDGNEVWIMRALGQPIGRHQPDCPQSTR